MTKNTGNTSFRKIDVDAIGEDGMIDEEADVDTPGLGPDENEVGALLNQNRHLDALKIALKNPPLKTRNQAVKDRATQLIVRVLTSFKLAEIEKAVQSLDHDQLDLLMKYIYKGFEFPQDGSSSSLLVWHEKTVAVGGLGCIVRTLTNRKRL